MRTEDHTKSRNYFLKEGRKSAGASPDHVELGTAGLDFSVPVPPVSPISTEANTARAQEKNTCGHEVVVSSLSCLAEVPGSL